MKVTVLIVTYRRGKLIENALNSLVNQSLKPDEVVIVLKPSGDGSEQVISEFSDRLNIKIVLQNEGGFIDALFMGIEDASGDILLFLDDDGIAHTEWILRFVKLFEEYKNIGGITGFIKKADVNGSNIVLKDDPFYNEKCAEGPHRKPLKILENYDEYFATSGLLGLSCKCLEQDKGIIKSTLFAGLNMGFKLNLIKGYPLTLVYKGSRIGWWWENFIALNVVLRGYDTIRVRHPSIATIVYHTVNVSSLTRGKGFGQEFWASFDRSISYWRLKMFGVKVNFLWYLLGQAIIIRKKPLPRLVAFFYTLFAGLFYYIKYKNQVRSSLTNKII